MLRLISNSQQEAAESRARMGLAFQYAMLRIHPDERKRVHDIEGFARLASKVYAKSKLPPSGEYNWVNARCEEFAEGKFDSTDNAS